jgi:hypothetical protein
VEVKDALLARRPGGRGGGVHVEGLQERDVKKRTNGVLIGHIRGARGSGESPGVAASSSVGKHAAQHTWPVAGWPLGDAVGLSAEKVAREPGASAS